jgi:hypothetical protein
MQVMLLSVQNSVPYKDLGTATSSAAFFRSIGGSIGVAVFGTIFANRLTASLPASLRASGNTSTHFTPEQFAAFKHSQPALYTDYLHAFGHALHIVFLAAVPFSAAGILLALMLREVPLRQTSARSAGRSAAESQAMPEAAETVMTEGAIPEGRPATAR